MRIAILNYAADVGKSTLALHLLQPRIPNAEVCAIDPRSPLNSSGVWDLMSKVVATKNIIVDVPYWQTENVLHGFMDYRGSLEDYDFFLVPTIPASFPAARNTIVTIGMLRHLGVPAQKIRLVFNCIGRETDLSQEFSPLHKFWKNEKAFVLNTSAAIHHNQLFLRYYGSGLTLAQIREAPVEYLQKVAATDHFAGRYERSQLTTAKRLVSVVQAELDAVFRAIVE